MGARTKDLIFWEDKMKDACKMTGLTEKAIRLYMEKQLVEPKVEEGVHRNAYYFNQEDVERLKDIATLRNAGFGLADIKKITRQNKAVGRNDLRLICAA